jgi:NAD+ synthase (glutamine-hydrolysing)
METVTEKAYEPYNPADSYLRVATARPEVGLADVATNTHRIGELYVQAASEDVSLVTFPELSLTGYTIGDLVKQTALMDDTEIGLQELAALTATQNTAMVVGLPYRFNNSLYNCAAVLADGEIKGLVPKQKIPASNEFYEKRWYQPWNHENAVTNIGGQEVPIGTNMLFEIDHVKFGVEICEDAWQPAPPSDELALKGAVVVTNLSASPAQIGKGKFVKKLVEIRSGVTMGGYSYAGCASSESTASIVMSGQQLIAENGITMAETKPFENKQLLMHDFDIDHLKYDRLRIGMANILGALVVPTQVKREQADVRTHIDRHPFMPEESAEEREERFNEIITIQAYSLYERMKDTHQSKLVLGLSGGLDSTLALLVAVETAKLMGKKPGEVIETLTMPGLASSEDTQSNAQLLARQLGVPNKVIPINNLSQTMLHAIGHDGITQDIAYENVQARARTDILFNYGNMNGEMVLGTGDLSEIALGWCTYNGDQQSHYHVNASIPKTLVKYLVEHASNKEEFAEAQTTLQAILATTISPELTSAGEGEISQSTEELIGPYELHDFFLYNLVRWGDAPKKITQLAAWAYEGTYTPEEITKWFGVFIGRFARSQFKRNNAPDGVKVGSVSLDSRGDFRMPPDLYNAAIWGDELRWKVSA